MSVASESVIGGKYYLIPDNKVARVLRIPPENQVHYEFRARGTVRAFGWKAGLLELAAFAFLVEREIPCNWIPERESGTE